MHVEKHSVPVLEQGAFFMRGLFWRNVFLIVLARLFLTTSSLSYILVIEANCDILL